MRILAIRIKNLASLDGKIEIDFTAPPLASAGIFAITGPTGAGKSTLLDAICLALYAETPRYIHAENSIDVTDVKNSTIKQDDARGILRDGTSEGYAEVDFVAVDAQHYCASWSVRRAHNRVDGNLQNYEMRLKNISTNQDIPGKKTEILTEIERLVGLNFQQFTRSVLLAQGDFTAFLKAGKDEKSSLLEKLTGTHIYSEISKRIYENHRQHQQDLKGLHDLRGGINTLTAEEIAGLQERKNELDSTIKTNTVQIAGLKKEIAWHEESQKLQESVMTARQQFEEKESDKAGSLPRQKQLQQVVAIQPAGPILRDLKSTLDQLGNKSKQAEELAGKLSLLTEEKTVLDISIEQATNKLANETKNEQDAAPLLNMARALDVKISEKKEQISQANREVVQVKLTHEKQIRDLLETQQESTALEEKIATLDQWKATNEPRRQVAEQHQLIISKLQDAEDTLKNLKHYTKRIANSEAETDNLKKQRQELSEKKVSVQSLLQQSQNEYNTLKNTLSVTDISDIENQQSLAVARIEGLISGSARWTLLLNATAEKETQQQLLLKNREDLELQSNELTKITGLLEEKRIEKDILLTSLEKARLVAAESVEELRGTLEPGQPCPVCGSTTHPYTAGHPVLEKVLHELDTNYKQSENEYLKLLSTQSGLKITCSHLKEAIATHEENITHKEKQIQGLEKEWQRLSICKEAQSIAAGEINNWLQDQLQQQKNSQQQLQQTIQSYKQQKEQLEIYRIQELNLQNEINGIENEIRDVDRDLQIYRDQRMTEVDEQKKANDNLLNLKQTLSIYFPTEQWFQQWQTNPETFVKRITDFAEEWRTNARKIEDYTIRHTAFTVKVKGMQEKTAIIKEELTSKEIKSAGLLKGCDTLSNDRKSVFNGRAAEEVEAQLRNAITLARQQLQKKNEEKEILLARIIQDTTNQDQLKKDITLLSAQELSLKEAISEWLSNHNKKEETAITEADLNNLLSFSQHWIEEERSYLRALDDALMQAKTVLGERELKLQHHSTLTVSNRSQEELNSLEKEVQEILSANNRDIHHIEFQIKEDTANKQKIGKLLDQIEQQAQIVENWSKLNEIIGSADGKKFRQTAQEYTLDLLISYANVHLELLSKRYLLQRIPNTLGLQVLDQDMGDEIRTVYSLSGGESFLVSLALALGLASLSSSRMKVESLFIDEGFGSLDPATLNIAMDALEMLHNQGRKVGVISHVQEMTDRIPVQIRVSKQNSGKSKVEII